MTGATLKEILENGTRMAEELKQGRVPEGTMREDWKLAGNLAVYIPYIPLQVTKDVPPQTETQPGTPSTLR